MEVHVDASFKLPAAGLAVVCEDFECSRLVLASSALDAEWQALRLAMDAAYERGLDNVSFLCDNGQVTMPLAGLVEVREPDLRAHLKACADLLAERPGWRVRWQSRRQNLADTLSRRVRGRFEDSAGAREGRSARDRFAAGGDAAAGLVAEQEIRRRALYVSADRTGFGQALTSSK